MPTLQQLVWKYIEGPGTLRDKKRLATIDAFYEGFENRDEALVELCQKTHLQPSEWGKLSNRQKVEFIRAATGQPAELEGLKINEVGK